MLADVPLAGEENLLPTEKMLPPALCRRIKNSAAIAMMMASEMWIQAKRDIFICLPFCAGAFFARLLIQQLDRRCVEAISLIMLG